jgi:hypothetical protein
MPDDTALWQERKHPQQRRNGPRAPNISGALRLAWGET